VKIILINHSRIISSCLFRCYPVSFPFLVTTITLTADLNLMLQEPFYHRIIEWFGLEGTLKTISFQPRAMSRDTFHYTRLLKAPSNLALDTAREGADTASLGNLFQCLNTLIIKNFFFITSLNLSSFSLKPLPLVLSLHALVKSPSPAFL